MTDRFIAACATGDLDGLLAVLAPGALLFTMRGQVTEAVQVIGDPRKLAFLRLQLSVPAR